jgi:hypothetical protein
MKRRKTIWLCDILVPAIKPPTEAGLLLKLLDDEDPRDAKERAIIRRRSVAGQSWLWWRVQHMEFLAEIRQRSDQVAMLFVSVIRMIVPDERDRP